MVVDGRTRGKYGVVGLSLVEFEGSSSKLRKLTSPQPHFALVIKLGMTSYSGHQKTSGFPREAVVPPRASEQRQRLSRIDARPLPLASPSLQHACPFDTRLTIHLRQARTVPFIPAHTANLKLRSLVVLRAPDLNLASSRRAPPSSFVDHLPLRFHSLRAHSWPRAA